MMGALVMPRHGHGLGTWDGQNLAVNQPSHSWGGWTGGVKGLGLVPDGSRRRKASSNVQCWVSNRTADGLSRSVHANSSF
jgi:hypothetical protein